MSSRVRVGLVVFCLAISGVAAGDQPIYETTALEVVLAAPANETLARRINAATDSRDGDALLELLDLAAALPEPARTMMTFHVLLALAAASPEPAATPTLERHARDATYLRMWHDEEGRRVAVAAYDTGAAARFTLGVWRRVTARTQAVAELREGAFALEKSTHADSATMAGYADALVSSTIDDLHRTRPGVASALADGAPVEVLALVLVERLQDRELAGLLLTRAPAEFVVRSLDAVAGAFPPDVAFDLLAGAASRPDVASAVVLRIGEIARSVPAARIWLHAQIGVQPHGASAAAALARIADTTVVMTLAGQLREARDPLVRARAALALNLADRDDARAALAEFVDRGEGPEALRLVIVQWLR